VKLHKITSQHQAQRDATAAYHPHGTGATPMVMPMAELSYVPDPGYPWGTASYVTLHPVWAADNGGVVAAYDSAAHARVIPAGRLSPAHG